jgi:GDP/UDP-N,N'-diacetylbacillosamine 2-epimerase (hydrolysing)
MQKICVISSSRADYGIMSNLIKKIKNHKDFKLNLIITGSHLSKKFGLTANEIVKDKIAISDKIYIKDNKNYYQNISHLINQYSKVIKKINPKIVILLGDRYEIFAAAISSYLHRIPIGHIHGGEVTSGSMDDGFRHSITKLSYLHFAATNKSQKRILQLGEKKSSVFYVGSLSLENIKKIKFLTKSQIEKKYNTKLKKKVAFVVFHPNTIDVNNDILDMNKIISTFKVFSDYSFIFSGSNIDMGGIKISKKLKEFSKKNNFLFQDSFGKVDFLSIIKFSRVIVGNSSSGIIEAPSLKTFTINIGERQKGRELSKSIFNSSFDNKQFFNLFKKLDKIKDTNKYFQFNPYKSMNGSDKIISILKKPIKNNFNFKNFNDL